MHLTFTSSVTRRSVEDSAIHARLEKRLAPPQKRRGCPTVLLIVFVRESGDYIGNARGQLLRVADVQELVRPVRVRVRPKHAGDEELRLRKLGTEHRHERDGAALAH